MEPLAQALDILQGDLGMYIGYLLPVLYTLKQKLVCLETKELNNCYPLITAIQSGLKKRLFHIFVYLFLFILWAT